MTPLKRVITLVLSLTAVAGLVAGCHPAVTGKGAMPDDSSMSPGQKRAAMIKWHQQHDKPQPGADRSAAGS